MTTKALRPMLAVNAPENWDALRWPMLASPKIDGVRCLVVDPTWYAENHTLSRNALDYVEDAKHAILVSRSMKPIPNQRLQSLFDQPGLVGLDGELVAGDAARPGVFRETNSVVMTLDDWDGAEEVMLHAFDVWTHGEKGFADRYARLRDMDLGSRVQIVQHQMVIEPGQLLRFEEDCLTMGYEGAMIRRPDFAYKRGRATAREQSLLKIKRFEDGEALVVGYEALRRNHNAAELDERGYTKRSVAQAGREAIEQLGALIVRNGSGQTFKIGTGFCERERKNLWEERITLPGRVVKYKAMPSTKELPRHPVFLGFRSKGDL